jgi:hypothetical protein
MTRRRATDGTTRTIGRWPKAAAAALALLAALARPAAARVLLSQEEALALAFPGCRSQRETAYLTRDQVAAAARLAGEPVASALVHLYRGCGDARGAVAYFDTHLVRTLSETVMVVVDAQARVSRVEVLSFQEPPDYLPRGPWYEQFHGRPLDDELRLKRAVRPVTGATLTARATTAAVRRVLALHQVIATTPKPAPRPQRESPSVAPTPRPSEFRFPAHSGSASPGPPEASPGPPEGAQR